MKNNIEKENILKDINIIELGEATKLTLGSGHIWPESNIRYARN